jgi:hypothetical protein
MRVSARHIHKACDAFAVQTSDKLSSTGNMALIK